MREENEKSGARAPGSAAVSCLFVGSAGGERGGELIGALQHPRCTVEHHEDIEEARARAASAGFELVVFDLRDPEVDIHSIGADWSPSSAIAVTCGPEQRQRAIDALAAGIATFACEPYDVQQVAAVLRGLAFSRFYQSELARALGERPPAPAVDLLVGRSPVMRRLEGAIRRACEIDATVLVEGAPGTGKSLVARMLHRAGRRGAGPLVTVCSASLSEPMLAAAIEDAAGGTLLIEDIERMPAQVQSKLVRRLKERSPSDSATDARIIATTTGKLAELTAKGAFREDLYYRLNVFPMQMPLLRERAEDVAQLALELLREASALSGTPEQGFSPAALILLETNPWPGNVAQLRNAVFRAHVASSGKPIDRVHLLGPVMGVQAPPDVFEQAAPQAEPEQLRESDIVPFHEEEKRILNRALKACKGNVRRAAELLGIGRATLYRKIQIFELSLS